MTLQSIVGIIHMIIVGNLKRSFCREQSGIRKTCVRVPVQLRMLPAAVDLCLQRQCFHVTVCSYSLVLQADGVHDSSPVFLHDRHLFGTATDPPVLRGLDTEG